jgi:hypothetical protein
MRHPTSTRQVAPCSVRLLSQASLPPRAEIKGDPSRKFNVRIDICLTWTGACACGRRWPTTPNTQRSGFNNPSDRKEMHVPVRRYCLSNSGLHRAPRKPGRATARTLPNLSAMAARRGGGIGIHDFRSQAAHSAVFAACAMRPASARAVAMCAYRQASQEPPRSPAPDRAAISNHMEPVPRFGISIFKKSQSVPQCAWSRGQCNITRAGPTAVVHSRAERNRRSSSPLAFSARLLFFRWWPFKAGRSAGGCRVFHRRSRRIADRCPAQVRPSACLRLASRPLRASGSPMATRRSPQRRRGHWLG